MKIRCISCNKERQIDLSLKACLSDSQADKVIYTGAIDAYFGFKQGVFFRVASHQTVNEQHVNLSFTCCSFTA